MVTQKFLLTRLLHIL